MFQSINEVKTKEAECIIINENVLFLDITAKTAMCTTLGEGRFKQKLLDVSEYEFTKQIIYCLHYYTCARKKTQKNIGFKQL